MRNKCGIKATTKYEKNGNQDGIFLSLSLFHSFLFFIPVLFISFTLIWLLGRLVCDSFFSHTLTVQEAKWWNKYYQRVLYTYGLACARLSSQEKHYTEQDLLLLLLLCCCFDRVLRELRSLFLSHFSIFTVMLYVRYWTFSLCYMQKKRNYTVSFCALLTFLFAFCNKNKHNKNAILFLKDVFFFLGAFSPVRSVLFIYFFFFQTIPFLDCKIYPFVHNSCVNLGFVFCLFVTACGGRRSIDTDIVHRSWFFFFSLQLLPCG